MARHCLLDWLGAALGGSGATVAGRVRAAAAVWSAGAGAATVIGRPERAGALDATLLNGVAGHALELDDTNRGPFHGHATAAVLPAAIALGEQRDLALADVTAALAAGVAGASALGAQMNPEHYDAGWHATATLGTIGAALACAALLGADARTRRRAVGHAGLQAAGLVAAFGSMAKAVQVGRAAANGLSAALLADAGVDAPERVLDGSRGMAAVYDGRPGDWAETGEHAILATSFKAHASCHSTHAAIDAIARLRAEHRLDAAAIDAIEVVVAPALLAVCDIADPRTADEAKFSLRAAVALAALGADTGDPAAFSRSQVRAPATRRLIGATAVGGDAGLGDWEARVTVRLRGGRALAGGAALPPPPGEPAAQAATVRRKFLRLAAPVLGSRRAADVADAVTAPGRDPGTRGLTAMLRTPA